ncbi:MAG: PqqD family protein [Clostridia bacterium]|nr:PqqD family protein [Clostridia bacterium]
MKIKSGFILKEVAGENILMFMDPALKNKVITLNETGALLFNLISEGKSEDEILSSFLSEYDVDADTAKADIKNFIASLSAIGALED